MANVRIVYKGKIYESQTFDHDIPPLEIKKFVEKIVSFVKTEAMTIKEIQDEIVDEFSMFDDWMQRYEYIIELGKTLPLIEEKYKTEDNIIKGCQSKVWLQGEEHEDKIVFTADSDAILTKGIIAILIRAFSDQKPADILEANTDFIDEIGLKEHLSPTRANGLVSMIKNIKMYALAFDAKN